MKESIKKIAGKAKKYSIVAAPMALALSVGAFAAEGDPTSTAMSVIQAQLTSLQGDAVTIVGGAIALSAVFFGAKFLWNKFRSMAR